MLQWEGYDIGMCISHPKIDVYNFIGICFDICHNNLSLADVKPNTLLKLSQNMNTGA